jgi:hypothetical protein
MSDLELIELAFTRVRDSYRGSPDTRTTYADTVNLLDRIVNELRKVKQGSDPHHGLGRAGKMPMSTVPGSTPCV